jgi:hypothetical protein
MVMVSVSVVVDEVNGDEKRQPNKILNNYATSNNEYRLATFFALCNIWARGNPE